MRRLDVVLEPTKKAVLDVATKSLPAALRDTMLKQAAGVDFYNTSEFTMRGLLADADGIRENLTKYVTSFSPEIADIFDKFKIFDVIKDLDDTENIPLTESVEEYMAREVLPYAPDAWIEPRKQKKGQLLELRDGGTVGYEIPFTRHFYEYAPLRPSAEILAEIRELEESIAEKLEKAGL